MTWNWPKFSENTWKKNHLKISLPNPLPAQNSTIFFSLLFPVTKFENQKEQVSKTTNTWASSFIRLRKIIVKKFDFKCEIYTHEKLVSPKQFWSSLSTILVNWKVDKSASNRVFERNKVQISLSSFIDVVAQLSQLSNQDEKVE